jgi:hypothetical protein
MKKKAVRKGQSWAGTGKRGAITIQVLKVGPYAAMVRHQSGRRTEIGLDRFNPHCGWRLVYDPRTPLPQESIPTPNPVADPEPML